MKNYQRLTVLVWLLWALAIVGEVRCIYKAVKCDWNPIGKAEIIYTAAAFTGFGTIVGWFNIADN